MHTKQIAFSVFGKGQRWFIHMQNHFVSIMTIPILSFQYAGVGYCFFNDAYSILVITFIQHIKADTKINISYAD
jgi:hypothetical protein